MRRIIAGVLVAGAAMFVAPAAQADHQGCMVIGEVQGLDTLRTCTYVARTPTQNVYVGTPYEWRIWVLRDDAAGEPVDLTLASGVGPAAGALPTVSPQMGETVNVTMSFGCTPPYCGTIGFLAAGLEQGHP